MASLKFPLNGEWVKLKVYAIVDALHTRLESTKFPGKVNVQEALEELSDGLEDKLDKTVTIEVNGVNWDTSPQEAYALYQAGKRIIIKCTDGDYECETDFIQTISNYSGILGVAMIQLRQEQWFVIIDGITTYHLNVWQVSARRVVTDGRYTQTITRHTNYYIDNYDNKLYRDDESDDQLITGSLLYYDYTHNGTHTVMVIPSIENGQTVLNQVAFITYDSATQKAKVYSFINKYAFKIIEVDSNGYVTVVGNTQTAISGFENDAGFGTYSKPTTGIPKTDLATDVQSSLSAADTALQEVPSTYRTAAEQDIIDGNKADKPLTAQTVVSPLTVGTIYDLGVQTSLSLNLPATGQLGDWLEVDFLSGTTATNLTVTSSAGMTDFDLTPSANSIYAIYANWQRIDVVNDTAVYGWALSYAENKRAVSE